MKNLIKRIRNANTWRERADIARDELPGTAFDYIFREVQTAGKMEKAYRPIALQTYERLGKWLALKITKGESGLLHELADAVQELKGHNPQPDHDLIALFTMSGLFPAGWEKSWGRIGKRKLVESFKPISRDARVKVAMRDLRKSIERRLGRNLNDGEWNQRRKRLQRYAKEFHIPLDNTPTSRQ